MMRTTMRYARPALIVALVVLLPVAACRKAPEPQPETDHNQAEEAPKAPVPPPREPAPAPPPKPAKPKHVAVKWPEALPADQQMLDDADATGMTARVSRDGDGGGNDQ